MKLTLNVNLVIQAVATLIQIVNVFEPQIPAEYKQIAAAVVGVGQAIVALMSHKVNPDGTPATTAYQPSGTATK